MADLCNYDFKYLTENIVKLDKLFIKLYVYEFLKSERSISSTRRMRRIFDAKYEKADINKVITEKY